MKKPRYTEQHIGQALREVDPGTAATRMCRNVGVTETTYLWKNRYARQSSGSPQPVAVNRQRRSRPRMCPSVGVYSGDGTAPPSSSP
jgi:hypothetical protein